MADALDTARLASERHDWAEAREAFAEAEHADGLSPDDLKLLGDAAWWAGYPDEAVEAYEGAYAGYVADGDNATASPIAGDGKIYCLSEDGTCYVIKPGPTFEILAVNELDEVCMASPAVANGRLFIRARKHLYCIGT